MKKRLLQTLITCTVVSSLIVVPVMATPQDEVTELENQKKAIQQQAASVNSQLVSLLVDYDALTLDIENQKLRIAEAETNLKEAEEKEQQQYDDMKLRIKYMYEEGDTTFIETLVEAKNFSELVNKAEYVQKVHDYDRDMLDEYVETKNEVKELKVELEAGQAEMEAMADEMEIQKANLESTLTQMRSQIADFDSQLEVAKAEAAQYLEELRQQQEEQERQEAENSKPSNNNNSNNNTNSNTNNNTSNNNSSNNESSSNQTNKEESKPEESKKEEAPSTPSNASLGQQIANKACQYIGNKYVYGGNSLTNGIDCSGFTQQIHAKFGISLPRTSSAQRTGGKAVSWANRMPGDVICYSGHVAIYIGNNTIVHASNSQPYPKGGIKTTSPANYRTVLAVRRYW